MRSTRAEILMTAEPRREELRWKFYRDTFFTSTDTGEEDTQAAQRKIPPLDRWRALKGLQRLRRLRFDKQLSPKFFVRDKEGWLYQIGQPGLRSPLPWPLEELPCQFIDTTQFQRLCSQ